LGATRSFAAVSSRFEAPCTHRPPFFAGLDLAWPVLRGRSGTRRSAGGFGGSGEPAARAPASWRPASRVGRAAAAACAWRARADRPPVEGPRARARLPGWPVGPARGWSLALRERTWRARRCWSAVLRWPTRGRLRWARRLSRESGREPALPDRDRR
jgi:hypothetical protein